MRLWNDNAFQIGLCLLILASICAVFIVLSPPLRSELTAVAGVIERIKRIPAGRFRRPKMFMFVRTPDGTIQIAADPKIDRGNTLAPGQEIEAMVSYEDILGRDVASLYELSRGPESLLRYSQKASAQRTQNRVLGNLSPFLALAGVSICGMRWRKFS